MSKITNIARINGQTFTRTSVKAYSHVVVAQFTQEYIDQWEASYPGSDMDANVYIVIGWASRHDLARKSLAGNSVTMSGKVFIYKNVTILEVE